MSAERERPQTASVAPSVTGSHGSVDAFSGLEIPNHRELLGGSYLHPLDQAVHQECVLRERLMEDLEHQDSSSM